MIMVRRDAANDMQDMSVGGTSCYWGGMND